MKRSILTQTAMGLGLSLLVSACAMETEGGNETFVDEQEVGVESQPMDFDFPPPVRCRDTVRIPDATTAMNTYAEGTGDNIGVCGFLHEVRTEGLIHASAGWDDVQLGDSTACVEARLSVTIYGHSNGTWSTVERVSRAGSVNPNGLCNLSEVVYMSAQYDKVRIVTQATLPFGGSVKRANVKSAVLETIN